MTSENEFEVVEEMLQNRCFLSWKTLCRVSSYKRKVVMRSKAFDDDDDDDDDDDNLVLVVLLLIVLVVLLLVDVDIVCDWFNLISLIM